MLHQVYRVWTAESACIARRWQRPVAAWSGRRTRVPAARHRAPLPTW